MKEKLFLKGVSTVALTLFFVSVVASFVEPYFRPLNLPFIAGIMWIVTEMWYQRGYV